MLGQLWKVDVSLSNFARSWPRLRRSQSGLHLMPTESSWPSGFESSQRNSFPSQHAVLENRGLPDEPLLIAQKQPMLHELSVIKGAKTYVAS